MNTSSYRGSGLRDRFFWSLSFKHRKILIPILLGLIFCITIFLIQAYINMDRKLKLLSHYEPIYVLALNKDLNIGDVIRLEDLKPMIFYKSEYEKLHSIDSESKLQKPSLIQCNYDGKSLSGFEGILGRVLNMPVYASSFLRQEYLAPKDTLPGLMNLLDEKHLLIDVEAPQTGFNIFIKPNDFVDLYELTQTGSNLIASKVKVILVDSLPLGKAPLQVAVDSKLRRELSLSISEENFAQVARAKKQNTLVVTYKNKEAELVLKQNHILSPRQKQSNSAFEPLTLIQGDKKEIHKQ